jgi:hypothetical protein
MWVVPASDYYSARFVVYKLSKEPLAARLELNVKCISILRLRCARDADPGRLVSRPDQSSGINGDASIEWLEWLECVNRGCERPGRGVA